MIISLSGKKQSGKTSVATYLMKEHGFSEVAFSGPLKEIIGRQLFGLTEAQLYGKESDKERIDFRWNLSPREILQKVGTDMFRNNFGKDFWVQLAISKIKELQHKGIDVVVPDCRFPNELKTMKESGATTVRLIRSDYSSVDFHESEIALDNTSFDYDITATTGQLENVYIVIDSIVTGKTNAVQVPIR